MTTAKPHIAAKSHAIAKPTPHAPPFRLPDPRKIGMMKK